MPSSEITLLEQRIVQLEEQAGITPSKTLEQQAEEEAEASRVANAQVFRTKHAAREFGSDKAMEKALNTSIVVLINDLEDDIVQAVIPQMLNQLAAHKHRLEITMNRPGNGGGSRMVCYQSREVVAGIIRSWGFWEKDDPMFELSDDDLEQYTNGQDLPLMRLPNADRKSSDSTFVELDSGSTWASTFRSWLYKIAPHP